MRALAFTFLTLLVVSLSSCEVVGGIFKAGMWTGFLLIAIVVGLIIYVISRFNRRK